MPVEAVDDAWMEIAHVLCTDIVGYSKLPIDQQSDYLRQLTQVVRATEQFRAAEAAGKLVRLPTGDGMALAFQRRREIWWASAFFSPGRSTILSPLIAPWRRSLRVPLMQEAVWLN